MANINNYFLSNLSASVGISYDLKTNVLGSTNSPNSAIFNLSQIATLLTTGKPKFGIFDAENIFSLSFNNDYFSFTAGKVFYETQLINIQSQTFSCTSDLDYAGTKYFKFYFDYLDFVNFSNTSSSVPNNTSEFLGVPLLIAPCSTDVIPVCEL